MEKMIVYGCLLRTIDGTPLSATTDFANDADKRVREGKRYLKLMTKQLGKYPERSCLQVDDISIHCVNDGSTSYIVICDASYPHILAYSFLDELLKEFSILYTPSVVNSVRRPYAFIEFDSFLNKTRQKYNSPKTLASRVNIADMTADMNLHPPYYIKLTDLEPKLPPPLPSSPLLATIPSGSSYTTGPSQVKIANGSLVNGTVYRDPKQVGVALRLQALTWFGWLSLILAKLCLLLDIYRGFAALSMSSLEEYDGPPPGHAIIFLMEGVTLSVQMYVLTVYSKFRKLETLVGVVLIIGLNIFLLDVREKWLCFLYIFVSIFLMIATFRRTFEKTLPKFCV
ncbi:vesicle-trafficking protein SEC22a-like [Oratosquilla oratoria]|uniref:vesicle-trafficking protein SEC22a-like n=1 Tax=Oratosquilla oratoria TaxID=337810 RepID=UPI003F775E14